MTYELDPQVRFHLLTGPNNFFATGDSGKWMFHVGMNQFPDAFKTISEAVHEGILGPVMYGNDRLVQRHNGRNLFCVFSRRSDRKSVLELLIELRDLGFDQDMVYKTDEATERGSRLGIGLDEHKWVARGYLVEPG